MLTLYLFRHAKSDWNDPSLADHERPLNDRGRRAAKFMGEFMNRKGLLPDVIACSTSKRTRETLDLLLPLGEKTPIIEYDDRIYEASANTLLYLVAEYAERTHRLMIIGHNPGIESLIYAMTTQHERIPTATLAVIQMLGDDPKPSDLLNIYRPKELMSDLA